MAISKREEIEAWVAAAGQGDRVAFGALVRQFQDAVAGVIVARLGRPDAVEDIAQETFLAAFRQLSTLAEPAKFGPWVCGIARNLALKWHRDRHPTAPLPPEVPANPARDRPDTADAVMDAVGRLPHHLREPLTLFYINGYTTGEVADFLAIPAGTVRRRLHDARRRLRGHLEQTMADEIKRSAPTPEFGDRVLERVAEIRTQVADDAWVILVDLEDTRSFPIMIGQREMDALQRALGQKPPAGQPLLYDLILVAAREFGIRVDQVVVTELKHYTFYALIVLDTTRGPVTIDARPSDAINLAVRAGVEVQVTSEVVAKALPPGPQEPFAPAMFAGLSLQDVERSVGGWRRRLAVEPANCEVRLEVAERFLNLVIYRVYRALSDEKPEEAAARAAEYLAESRAAVGALDEYGDAVLRRRAALALGTVEYLEANWSEAVVGFDRYDGAWNELAWPDPLHCATALHQAGRDKEALARLRDALAAIDRMYAADETRGARMVARQTLAELVCVNLPGVAPPKRLCELFAPIEPPRLVRYQSLGLGAQFGGVHPLEPAETSEIRGLPPRPVTIGSAPEADIRIADAAPIHARLVPLEGGWILEAASRETGVWIGKERVHSHRLVSRTEFRVGEVFDAEHTFAFLDLASLLAAPLRESEPPRAVRLDGEMPTTIPLPLVETVRHLRPRVFPMGVIHAPPGPAEIDLSAGETPPQVKDWPTPWPVARVTAPEKEACVILAGPRDRHVRLELSKDRHNDLRRVIAGARAPRPQTAELTASFLSAVGLRCVDVVIGPSGSSSSRPARLRLSAGRRSAWFLTAAGDALALAFSVPHPPAIWVCH